MSAEISVTVAKATHIDHFTPMGHRFASEVAHAVAGMTRKDANAVVTKLLRKYEDSMDSPPVGKKYEECWDVHRKIPHEDYVTFYKNIKKEISDLGIPF